MVSKDRTRCYGHKLKSRKVCLNIRKNFLALRMVKYQNRLPRSRGAYLGHIQKSSEHSPEHNVALLGVGGFRVDGSQSFLPISAILSCGSVIWCSMLLGLEKHEWSMRFCYSWCAQSKWPRQKQLYQYGTTKHSSGFISLFLILQSYTRARLCANHTSVLHISL